MTDAELSPSAFRQTAQTIEDEIARVIVGQSDVVRHVVVALIAGGHVLLEGVPGLGKTLLVRTLADALSLRFSRIQFTPDLMPADITGTNIIEESESGKRFFAFREGPVFSNLVLADEINRATPKTQSALLEAMQEGTCTVANQIYTLPQPFLVMATQNPLEMEGTYPLPEAQLDRFFFKLTVPYPGAEDLRRIVTRTTSVDAPRATPVADGPTIERMRDLARQVPITSAVADYAVRLVLATHPDYELSPGMTRSYVRYGASPRGAQTLVAAAKIRALLESRMNVAYDDVQAMALPALRHRIMLNFDAEATGISADSVIARAIEAVPTTGF